MRRILSVSVGSAVLCVLMATSARAEHQGKSHGVPGVDLTIRARPSTKLELAAPKLPEIPVTSISTGTEPAPTNQRKVRVVYPGPTAAR